jgi:hypothetical protein
MSESTTTRPYQGYGVPPGLNSSNFGVIRKLLGGGAVWTQFANMVRGLGGCDAAGREGRTGKGELMNRSLQLSWIIAGFLYFTFTVEASTNVLDCERRALPTALNSLQEHYIEKLSPILSCKEKIDDRTACNRFLGRALELLFGNTDFKTDGGFMLANDIVNGLSVPGNAGWDLIGLATDQATLKKAQELANGGQPVVAARFGAKKVDGSRGPGHVVLIMPGSLELYSANGFDWGSLKTPNSASFFLDKPERMFLSCPLSATWRKPNDVKLYVKKN